MVRKLINVIDTDYPQAWAIQKEFIRKRNQSRLTRRLTFDCLKAKYQGSRVRCVLHPLSDVTEDFTLTIRQVIKTMTPKRCQTCPDYVSMGDKEDE